jgi:dihydrofolate synthase / folylpolyglutamate synthase
MSSDTAPYLPSERHEAALRFLLDRIDYERTQSMPCSEEALKLDRMRELLARLGNPHEPIPVIHVAGTKGKGSTAAMIAAILSAAGHHSGLFTSPHLDRIEERIITDAQPCSAEELADLVELVRPEVEAMDRRTDIPVCHIPGEGEKGTGPICAQHPAGRSGKLDLSPFPPHGPTYFEIVTAMALCHFARRRVDAAVLEVGMGGRLDSTNVCTPCVSIITSISFDHTKQLGGTLAAIAAEKAGIIKPGVPVVSGVDADEPREVIRRVARQNGCRLVELGVDFNFDYHPPRHLELGESPARLDFRCVQSSDHSRGLAAPGEARTTSKTGEPEDTFRGLLAPGYFTDYFSDIALSLIGRHQAANAAVALTTVEELRRAGWTIPETAVRRGLAAVVWPARVEVVGRRPAVVLDAAHNAASIAALIETLDESFSAPRRLLVFATTQEKDLRGMLSRLLGRFDHVIFTRYVNNPRGVPPEELQAVAVGCVLASTRSTDQLSDQPRACEHAPYEGRTTEVEIASTPADAWNAVHRLARPDDLVCVTGSFFLAAEMRRQIAAWPLDPGTGNCRVSAVR